MPAFESQAISSQGVKISVETAVAATFADLCEIKTFNGFDGQASEIDVTTICSEAKEIRMGLQDFGSFSFEMNYVPDDPGQILMQDAKAAGTPLNFKFTLPATYGEWTFSAYVKAFPIAGGVDGVLTSSVVLRLNGAATFTPGTLVADDASANRAGDARVSKEDAEVLA
jgi:hypothetical protein